MATDAMNLIAVVLAQSVAVGAMRAVDRQLNLAGFAVALVFQG